MKIVQLKSWKDHDAVKIHFENATAVVSFGIGNPLRGTGIPWWAMRLLLRVSSALQISVASSKPGQYIMSTIFMTCGYFAFET